MLRPSSPHAPRLGTRVGADARLDESTSSTPASTTTTSSNKDTVLLVLFVAAVGFMIGSVVRT